MPETAEQYTLNHKRDFGNVNILDTGFLPPLVSISFSMYHFAILFFDNFTLLEILS